MTPEGKELAAFLGFFFDRYKNADNSIPEELHPLRFVNQMLETAPKRAMSGLRMAVGDCIEMSSHWSPAQVKEADDAARARGVATLSEIRRRHWRRLTTITKRGKIRTEEEYYLVKGVTVDASPPSDELAILLALLDEFEKSAVS